MKLRPLYLLVLTLWSLSVCTFAGIAEAAVEVDEALGAPAIPGPLTAVGDVTKPEVPNVVFYDFKTIGTSQTEPILHDFVLRNTGSLPLTFDEVRVSCHCVTASLADGTPGDGKPLNPGQDLTVHISIDPQSLYVGKIEKVVWIFLTGQKTPAFTMRINGEIAAPASFEPQALDFGEVAVGASGKGLSKKLRVVTDTAVYGQKPPEPSSLKGLVKLVRDSEPARVVGTTIVRSYDVIISPRAGPGPLDDMIFMPLEDATRGNGPSLAVTGKIGVELSKPAPALERTLPGLAEAALLPRAEDDRLASIGLPIPRVQVGEAAPDFSVVDSQGKRWSLRSLRGARNVLLTFFPKCFTGGCASHLASLRNHQSEFLIANTQIIAVSVDPAEGEQGQKAFAKQWRFNFPLIPDTSRALCRLYGAVQNDDERAARMSVLIDKRGIVRYLDTDVKVQTHGADMMREIRALGLR